MKKRIISSSLIILLLLAGSLPAWDHPGKHCRRGFGGHHGGHGHRRGGPQGEIVEIDYDAMTMVLRTPREEDIDVQADDDTRVMKECEQISFSDLETGSMVAVRGRMEEGILNARRIMAGRPMHGRKLHGEITEMDFEGKSMTVECFRERETPVRTSEETVIRKGDEEISFEDLAPGMVVMVGGAFEDEIFDAKMILVGKAGFSHRPPRGKGMFGKSNE